jgi:hypothetical protein
MALRFHRSIKLLADACTNIGKRGIGISAFVPGLRVGVDSRGKALAKGEWCGRASPRYQ